MSVLIKLTVAAVLLGVVFAVEKPCCISNKWMGKMKITVAFLVNGSTVPVISESHMMFDNDRDMRMERVMGEVHTINGTMEYTTNYTVYNDYMHMKKYILADMGKCKVMMLTDNQTDPCVPATLQHMGTFMIGSTNAGVSVNAWMGMFKNFHFTYETTVADCTPVSMTRFGTDDHGTRISENIIYTDIIQNMTSPDAFTLPDDCKMVDMAVGK